jgi:ABC-2 type transport system permease protein
MNNAIALNSKGSFERMDNATAPTRKSGFVRELNAVVAIMARDVTLALKSPSTLVATLAMPAVMMGMIGGNLMQNMAGGLDFNFGGFMLVGMMVNMLFMTSAINMTSLVEDRGTDFTQEMLVSPVSRVSIVFGKILGSMFGAVVALAGTLAVGAAMGITMPLNQLLTLLLLSPLICVASGAFAMLFIGLIHSVKVANMIVSALTMSQMFLSGAIIPIGNSSGALYILSRIMPMTYCLDLVRTVIGSDYAPMFNPFVNFIAIAALTVGFLAVGAYFFARGEKNR